MTRETKVGMAVACSFLSLVAAVVVLRMQHGDEPDSATSGMMAQGKDGGTPGKDGPATVIRPAAEKQPRGREPGVLPAVFNSPGEPPPVSASPGAAAGNEGIPMPATPTAAVKDNPPGVPSPTTTGPAVAPPPSPAARPAETPAPPIVTPLDPPPSIPAPTAPPTGSPPEVGAGKVAGLPAPPASADLNTVPGLAGAEPSPAPANPKEPVTPPAVAVVPVDAGLPGLPPPPAAGVVPPAPPGAVATNKKLSAEEEQQERLKELRNQVAAAQQGSGLPAPVSQPAPTVPAPAPANGPEKGALAQGHDPLAPPSAPGLPPPPASAPLAGPGSTAKVEPPPGNPLAPPAPAPTAVKDQGPGAPGAVKPPDVALNGKLTPMDPPGTGTERLPGIARPGDAPPAVAMGPITADDAPPASRSPQGPRAPTPGLPTPPPPARAPDVNPAPLPPLGAPPAASSAPIAVPVPPPQAADSGTAKALSYDVETHRVQPGDSTFADLSKKLYGSDKYAQALLQFNREYPLAGDNLKADPPRLEPGQPIYVPPTHILEQPRYAAAPPPARPIASTPSPASTAVPPPVAVVPPRQPVMPAVPAVSSPVPTPQGPASAGTRSYTVQGNGEMLFEIARQTLGDGRRWSEIYRLNPDIRPELAIPGGTQLRLPAEARVGS